MSAHGKTGAKLKHYQQSKLTKKHDRKSYMARLNRRLTARRNIMAQGDLAANTLPTLDASIKERIEALADKREPPERQVGVEKQIKALRAQRVLLLENILKANALRAKLSGYTSNAI